MSSLKIDKLSFSYDKNVVLDNISFEVEKGEYITLMGHNGSGKSTLAKLIMGLLENKNGSIYIDDIEMKESNINELRNKLGIVFQNPDNQFIGATVQDDIAFGLENHLVKSEDMDKIINEFAESRTEEKNMEEKQIQIPDVNADAEERDNYTLIQETPEDDLPGENGIAIRYSKDFNIVQANELLRSKQSDLTLMESKLIRLAVSQIMKGDKDLRTYKVNVSQLAEFLEVPKTNVYRSMQDINISLMQRVIFIRDKEVPDKKGKPNYKILHWLSSVEYKDGTLTYRLSDELKPYLIGLSEMFTLYSYDSIIKLPTNYSIRLFELLTSWVNIIIKGENTPAFPDISTDPDEIVLAIDYLRDFFDCNDKYKSAGDFVRNVIEVNLGFINQYTNLKVSFRKHKKGRSISHVIFKYENTWNNDPKAEEHNNQMLDTIRSIKNGEPAQFETDKEVITF